MGQQRESLTEKEREREGGRSRRLGRHASFEEGGLSDPRYSPPLAVQVRRPSNAPTRNAKFPDATRFEPRSLLQHSRARRGSTFPLKVL